ncbi:hypothetical protein M378DRAFT_160551 [Amanita muscaria Koide BX008]|uniref:Uncharacterized protein n=1 Tax=Amanita muscaria (strain Koide BX008) TaxID=946122 RepID=A0A0C2THZ0_AMAMK|nr:hypothetical protein M378DRAFT_160551 [Amanita muscaria Koide BX008]
MDDGEEDSWRAGEDEEEDAGRMAGEASRDKDRDVLAVNIEEETCNVPSLFTDDMVEPLGLRSGIALATDITDGEDGCSCDESYERSVSSSLPVHKIGLGGEGDGEI